MIVMKFGGTSVEDAVSMKNVATIVQQEIHQQPIVVLSACSGTTNQLLRIAQLASQRNKEEALQHVASVEGRHKKIVSDLFDKDSAKPLHRYITTQIEELAALVNGIVIVGELTPRSLDIFASYGERLSSSIFYEYLKSQNISSALVDARTFMVTDENFTKAAPLFSEIEKKMYDIISPELQKNKIVVTQGFIGATKNGVTTTIGRGGSDYSAAIIGALLNAKDIQIWTDVDGILTAAPNIVKNAKKIKVMSFNEAAELAYFGAKVLHPETILPAVNKNIPVRVLNSKRPESTGTLIVAKPSTKQQCIIKSIAYKEGITIISIVSSRMFLAHGFLENIFDVFHKYQTVVHTVVTSEVSVSVSIDNSTHLSEIVKELQKFSTVTVNDKKAIVCVTGEHIKSTPGIAAKVMNSLADININMISQGASEITIGLVIDEINVQEAVQRLHIEFFSDVSQLTEIFE